MPASGREPPLLSCVLCQPWHPVCSQPKTELDAHKWTTQKSVPTFFVSLHVLTGRTNKILLLWHPSKSSAQEWRKEEDGELRCRECEEFRITGRVYNCKILENYLRSIVCTGLCSLSVLYVNALRVIHLHSFFVLSLFFFFCALPSSANLKLCGSYFHVWKEMSLEGLVLLFPSSLTYFIHTSSYDTVNVISSTWTALVVIFIFTYWISHAYI